MWVGKGTFSSFGYLSGEAYFKGAFNPNADRALCYLVVSNDVPGSENQYGLIPVDEHNKHIGDALYRTSGQVLYSTWSEGNHSPNFNISDSYIKD